MFAEQDRLGDKAGLVMAAMSQSHMHGRDPADYLTDDLKAAVVAASGGDERAVRQADKQLSSAFLRWAHDLDATRATKPVETDREAVTAAFEPEAALRKAATTHDLRGYLDGLERRHPIYNALASSLRNELATGGNGEMLATNVERARWLPAAPVGKHIVVDAAGARLGMFDGVALVDTMKVVIGRPDMPTPIMSGMMRHVIVNPYWNLPVDIVRDSIAPAVVRRGTKTIDQRNLEILSDWGPNAKPVPATAVDWSAVAAGKKDLRVRQRPGADNMMGDIKFMFPNDLGIYLHDTPIKSDFKRLERARSSGCVRVEDAARLARWLFDGKSPLGQPGAEHAVALPRPVPVYISYFTVSPFPGGPARSFDVYGLDASIPGAKRGRQVAAQAPG